MKLSTFFLVTCAFLGWTATVEPAMGQETKDIPGEVEKSQNIVTLLQQFKVEIQTSGSGIQRVTLRVRRRVAQPVTVSIPIGIVFENRTSGVQNMITTGATIVTLNNDEWVPLSIPVACATRQLKVPEDSHSFRVRQSKNQDLVKVLPQLERWGESFAVRQAVVWIMAEDANYDELGTLIRVLDKSRMIREGEANRAMELMEQAGINLAEYRISLDRERIRRGLQK